MRVFVFHPTYWPTLNRSFVCEFAVAGGEGGAGNGQTASGGGEAGGAAGGGSEASGAPGGGGEG
eukprot:5773213-Pyramimonas_sp.AAC.1